MKGLKAKIRTIKDLVFPTFNGTKILPSNLRRTFYEALKKRLELLILI
jgi:hypothetical protein